LVYSYGIVDNCSAAPDLTITFVNNTFSKVTCVSVLLPSISLKLRSSRAVLLVNKCFCSLSFGIVYVYN
jgi:hypothetical protein